MCFFGMGFVSHALHKCLLMEYHGVGGEAGKMRGYRVGAKLEGKRRGRDMN